MGNLLSFIPSFIWQDPERDRGKDIQLLNGGVTQARSHKDNIYKPTGMMGVENTWQEFLEFILHYGYDEDIRRARFPWMSQIQHTTLLGLVIVFKNAPEIEVSNHEGLERRFHGENNGLIGLVHNLTQLPYVSCPDSWRHFHSLFVSKFNFRQRCENFEYFKTFFIPDLSGDLNAINRLIRVNKVSSCLERLDPPLIPHEQYHVHFKTEDAALNLDGTWKHPPSTKFKIPKGACELLSAWGFLLPDNCYQ